MPFSQDKMNIVNSVITFINNNKKSETIHPSGRITIHRLVRFGKKIFDTEEGRKLLENIDDNFSLNVGNRDTEIPQNGFDPIRYIRALFNKPQFV